MPRPIRAAYAPSSRFCVSSSSSCPAATGSSVASILASYSFSSAGCVGNVANAHITIENTRITVPAFFTYSQPRCHMWMSTPLSVGIR